MVTPFTTRRSSATGVVVIRYWPRSVPSSAMPETSFPRSSATRSWSASSTVSSTGGRVKVSPTWPGRCRFTVNPVGAAFPTSTWFPPSPSSLMMKERSFPPGFDS